jgi:hypothetical protein
VVLVLGMKRGIELKEGMGMVCGRSEGGGGEFVVLKSVLGHEVGKRGPFCAT